MTDNEEKIAVLMSGGINGIALLSHYAKKANAVCPIFIQNGFRWEESELYWLKKFLRQLKVANVEQLNVLSLPLRDTYGSHWSVTGVKAPSAQSKPAENFLPARNILFLAKASLFATMNGINTIALGVNKNYPFEDASINYLKLSENILSKSLGSEVKVLAPFLEKSKDELIHEGSDFGFEYSFSCLTPKGHLHCGECLKCGERKKAFMKAGIPDKTSYYKRHALSV